MDDTFFVIPADKAHRQADVYRPEWDGADTPPGPLAPMTGIANISATEGQDFSMPHVYEMGGGGLVSCLKDYTRFALMLLNKVPLIKSAALPKTACNKPPALCCLQGELDGVRVLSSNTVEWMSSNHLPGGADLPSYAAMERADVGIGFGLGFGMQLGPPDWHNRRGKGTFYWGGAASTMFWVVTDPARLVFSLRAGCVPHTESAVCPGPGERPRRGFSDADDGAEPGPPAAPAVHDAGLRRAGDAGAAAVSGNASRRYRAILIDTHFSPSG